MNKFLRIFPTSLLMGATLVLLVTLTLAVSCSRADSTQPAASPYLTPLTIGTTKLFVDVATTDFELQQGLSNRQKLTDNQGMFFDLKNAGTTRPGFWMKDMLFDLDLIWINNNRVVGITANVPAPNNPTENLLLYYPPAETNAVLEVNAGWAESHKIKVGDEIKF